MIFQYSCYLCANVAKRQAQLKNFCLELQTGQVSFQEGIYVLIFDDRFMCTIHADGMQCFRSEWFLEISFPTRQLLCVRQLLCFDQLQFKCNENS